jgi:hypothetical protein
MVEERYIFIIWLNAKSIRVGHPRGNFAIPPWGNPQLLGSDEFAKFRKFIWNGYMNDFKCNIKNIYGEKGKERLLNLPKIIEDLRIRFGLHETLFLFSNLTHNYVLSGFQGDILIRYADFSY